MKGMSVRRHLDKDKEKKAEREKDRDRDKIKDPHDDHDEKEKARSPESSEQGHGQGALALRLEEMEEERLRNGSSPIAVHPHVHKQAQGHKGWSNMLDGTSQNISCLHERMAANIQIGSAVRQLLMFPGRHLRLLKNLSSSPQIFFGPSLRQLRLVQVESSLMDP